MSIEYYHNTCIHKKKQTKKFTRNILIFSNEIFSKDWIITGPSNPLCSIFIKKKKKKSGKEKKMNNEKREKNKVKTYKYIPFEIWILSYSNQNNDQLL